MTICMCKVICITNRHLCNGDFLEQMEGIAKAHPAAIVLREKDMQPEEYKKLAVSVMDICQRFSVPCILHNFADIAIELNAGALHLPMHLLRKLPAHQKEMFRILGASCHSLEEAVEAEQAGCTYIMAGHVFETDCKKGVKPRGLEFLKEICGQLSIPVYALGGITAKNAHLAFGAGAYGVSVMSGLMKCENPQIYIKKFGK